MHQELIYGESKPNTLPDNGSGYNCKHTHPAIHKGTGLHNPQTVPPATLAPHYHNHNLGITWVLCQHQRTRSRHQAILFLNLIQTQI